MAIRRVSDLPDLSTIYHTDFEGDNIDNFKKCLFEVSYNHDANKYQSFSTPASMVKEYITQDFDQFVTISGNQTITGEKTFTNENGISIAIDYGTYNNYSGAIRGITETSVEINQAAKKTDVVPSVKSIVDYLSALYVPLWMLPPDILPTLCSLISNQGMTCYVDLSNGQDNDLRTGEYGNNSSFQTIGYAIERINRRRFIQNAEAHIRILGNYDETSLPERGLSTLLYSSSGVPKTIRIYHPDMVQNRKIYIEGWTRTTDNPSNIQRTLSASAVSCSVNDVWFNCMCNVEFSHCTFSNAIDYGYDESDNQLSTKNNVFYTIGGNTNIGSVTLKNCKFVNCYYAVQVNIVNLNSVNYFNRCHTALFTSNTGIGRSSLAGTIYCTDCNYFVNAQVNSVVRFSSTDPISYLMLAIHNSAFNVRYGASIYVNLDDKSFLDTRGKYIDTEHCFWLSHSISENRYELLQQPNSSSISQSVLKYAINRESGPAIGYDNNGYIAFTPTASQLSAYLSLSGAITSDKLKTNISATLLDTTGIYADLQSNTSTYWPELSGIFA